jgi:hypothetical protein
MNEIIKNDNNFLNFNEMKEASEIISASGLFPAYDSPAKIMTLMLLCKSEKCDPLKATMRYDLINGKPSKKSQAMLEDFINAGGKVNWIETNGKIAKAEFIAPNESNITESFTIEEAKNAGLTLRDNWKKYPKLMLRARCISSALRAIYPVSTGLLHDNDEIEESIEDVKPKEKLINKVVIEPVKKEQVEVAEEIKDAEVIDETPIITNLSDFDGKIQLINSDDLKQYLKSINWIKDEINELNEEQKKTIVDKWEAFQSAIEKYINKGAK